MSQISQLQQQQQQLQQQCETLDPMQRQLERQQSDMRDKEREVPLPPNRLSLIGCLQLTVVTADVDRLNKDLNKQVACT